MKLNEWEYRGLKVVPLGHKDYNWLVVLRNGNMICKTKKSTRTAIDNYLK